MSVHSQPEALGQLRRLLDPLAERFHLDDPGRGLLADIPVVGGTFIHPLTRVAIPRLTVYGAGPDMVKILEPRFLRTLPRVPVAGASHPSQFCAWVAKALSERLGELGAVRDKVSALGISMDLEHDVLRLSGRVELRGVRVRVTAGNAEALVVTAIGERHLAGVVPRAGRTLALTAEPTRDLDELARLVDRLEARLRGETPEAAESTPAAEPVGAARVAPGAGVTAGGDEEDVIELTEPVEGEEQASSPEQPATGGVPQDEAAQPVADVSPGAVPLRELFDKLGSETEVTAHASRLRLVVPLRIVQGAYTFYLEQVGPTRFKGVLQSPSGTRHPVAFDLREIADIKEIVDRVLMGR